ncbi:hypothetical protein K438DRAFT_1147614 [Mycena galopus ATCC 62051]|nr:hypothetical protein K438DRAFT_1147614 [Mycena galopus ATCC 62051]
MSPTFEDICVHYTLQYAWPRWTWIVRACVEPDDAACTKSRVDRKPASHRIACVDPQQVHRHAVSIHVWASAGMGRS